MLFFTTKVTTTPLSVSGHTQLSALSTTHPVWISVGAATSPTDKNAKADSENATPRIEDVSSKFDWQCNSLEHEVQTKQFTFWAWQLLQVFFCTLNGVLHLGQS